MRDPDSAFHRALRRQRATGRSGSPREVRLARGSADRVQPQGCKSGEEPGRAHQLPHLSRITYYLAGLQDEPAAEVLLEATAPSGPLAELYQALLVEALNVVVRRVGFRLQGYRDDYLAPGNPAHLLQSLDRRVHFQVLQHVQGGDRVEQAIGER